MVAAALLATAIAVLAYALGRWSVDPPATRTTPDEALAYAPAAATPAPPSPPPPASISPLQPKAVPPVAAAASPPESAPAPQDVVQRATSQARAQIELQRADIVSRCWPAAGLKGGRASAKVTFNIAFDAQGQEVMRGVSEDRRSPAGEFAKCLREMDGRVSIAAPGSNVNVAVPLTFP